MKSYRMVVRPLMREGFKRTTKTFADDKGLTGFVKKISSEDHLHLLALSSSVDDFFSEFQHFCEILEKKEKNNEYSSFRCLKTNTDDHEEGSSGSQGSSYTSGSHGSPKVPGFRTTETSKKNENKEYHMVPVTHLILQYQNRRKQIENPLSVEQLYKEVQNRFSIDHDFVILEQTLRYEIQEDKQLSDLQENHILEVV